MADFVKIFAANRSRPLLNPDGTASNELMKWIEAVTESYVPPPIFGTGSPESNVQGIPNQRYIQTDEVVSQREWIKQSGFGNTGWIQL